MIASDRLEVGFVGKVCRLDNSSLTGGSVATSKGKASLAGVSTERCPIGERSIV